MKRNILILSLIITFLTAQAQQRDVFIKDIDSSTIQVKILLNESLATTYRFEMNSPDHYGTIYPSEYISNAGLYLNETLVEPVKIVDEAITIKKPKPAQSIQYEVMSNYKSADVFMPLSTKFNNDVKIYNLAYILGSFNNDAYRLFINDKDYGTKTHSEWLASPIFLGMESIETDLKDYTLYTSPNTSHISIETLRKIINECIQAATNNSLFETKNLQPKTMYFVFDSLDKNTTALTHPDNIVFYFDKSALEKNPNQVLYHTVLRELIGGQLAENKQADKIWLNEALPDYFALKILLEKRIILEQDFLDIINEKHKLSKLFEATTLEKMSLNLSTEPENYQGFFTKGVFVSWMLDMIILDETDGMFGLFDFTQGDVAAMDEGMQIKVSNALLKFQEEYEADNVDFNYHLNNICMASEIQKTTTGEELEHFYFFEKPTTEQQVNWKQFIEN